MSARKSRIALAAPITAVALALSIAGCGGGNTSTTTSASADFQRFQDCLKQQGIQAPSGQPPTGQPPTGQPPTGGLPGGANSQKMQKAFQACQQYMPQVGPSGSFPGAPPSQQ
jgi:hypothetical protein